jgi:VIT1/CCC1 family predicted Fe2+/Mn2+ transporter
MRQRHVERHFTASDTVRDIVIGMSDGLTVPFALAAGLSGASINSALIVTAGLAEIAAGAIAMGLGGYLAGKSDEDHYEQEYQREHREVESIPEEEKKEVWTIFRDYGLQDAEIKPIVETLSQRPVDWVKFMMRFELNIERPDPARARVSAVTIAISYIVGGVVPLVPYMLNASVSAALLDSVLATMTALFLFGFIKGRFTGVLPLRSGLQTLAIGGLAAAAAFAIAKLVSAGK